MMAFAEVFLRSGYETKKLIFVSLAKNAVELISCKDYDELRN